MDTLAIKHTFEDKQFASLLQEYYISPDDFDDNELEDYAPDKWNIELHHIDMNEDSLNAMKALGDSAYNTTQQYDTFFSAITINTDYKDIFMWFVEFAGIENIDTMVGFDPNDYEEYRDLNLNS